MTLNGVIALTSPNRSVFSPNSVAFGTDYVRKWLKIHQHFLQRKCRPKNVGLVFSDILFIAIFVEVTKNECVTENRGQTT